MKEAAPYVYEFLYRGQPAGSDDAPAWHLKIEAREKNSLGKVVPHEQTFNMEQAKKAGWDLPKIITAINAGALMELDQGRASIAMLEQTVQQQTEIVLQQKEKIEHYKKIAEQRGLAVDGLSHEVSELHDQLASMREEAEAAAATIAGLKSQSKSGPSDGPRGGTGRRRARSLSAR